jgi:hypothetical protein
MLIALRGRSSVVEHQLPKLSVEGSIPFARSKILRDGVRARGMWGEA